MKPNFACSSCPAPPVRCQHGLLQHISKYAAALADEVDRQRSGDGSQQPAKRLVIEAGQHRGGRDIADNAAFLHPVERSVGEQAIKVGVTVNASLEERATFRCRRHTTIGRVPDNEIEHAVVARVHYEAVLDLDQMRRGSSRSPDDILQHKLNGSLRKPCAERIEFEAAKPDADLLQNEVCI